MFSRRMSALCLGLVLVAGCFESRRTEQPAVLGGESHFLMRCKDGDACGDGMLCVCGACTRPCDEGDGCEELAEGATCASAAPGNDTRECTTPKERAQRDVCDLGCSSDADCSSPDDTFECRAGVCRVKVAPPRIASDEQEVTPLVMMVVDTSGSMELMPHCECTTPACNECFPDCERGEQNRWTSVVGALTGSFNDLRCRSWDRTEANGAIYDAGYYLPHFEIMKSSQQRRDGVLDSYARRVRFGLATFDGVETYKGSNPLLRAEDFDDVLSVEADGMFSYPAADTPTRLLREDGSLVGDFFYPKCEAEYRMDTGVRSAVATEGALTLASKQAQMSELGPEMQRSLLTVRPYGGTPIAASLDDLYYLFKQDPLGTSSASTKAPRVVIVITDGKPDDDYRSYGCDCASEGDGACGDEDPSKPHCPYPTVSVAARHLRCGFGDAATACDGPVDQVYVVGVAIDDPNARAELDAIAAEGGSQRARFADGSASIYAEVSAILDAVIAGTP